MPAGISLGTAVALGTAAVSAGSAIAGAVGSSGAVSGASNAANQISQATIDQARTDYTANNANYQPYIDQGTKGINAYADATGVNGATGYQNALSSFQASPGYAYSVEQGLRGIDAGAASKGMLQSGATIKAEETLGNNLANQDFTNYLSRLNTLSNYGVQGSQGQANNTSTYNALASGQSSGQQQTLTSAGTQQASIYGNAAQGVTNAVGLANKNGLFSSGTSSSGLDASTLGTTSSVFGGAGTTYF